MCHPVVMAVMAVASHHMEEQTKKANRRMSDHSLTVSRAATTAQETNELLAASHKRQQVQRDVAMRQSQMEAAGAGRGIGQSAALASALQEYGARSNEYLGSVTADTSMKELATGFKLSSLDAKWQGEQMQNASSGVLGYAMAAGTGYMQGQMAFPDAGSWSDFDMGQSVSDIFA